MKATIYIISVILLTIMFTIYVRKGISDKRKKMISNRFNEWANSNSIFAIIWRAFWYLITVLTFIYLIILVAKGPP